MPLAGPRDWRVPLARRLVLAAGWAAFSAGIAVGVAGLVVGVTLAWAAFALAAVVGLASVVLVPEPRPATDRRRRRSVRLRPERIELPGLWAPRAGRHPVSVDLLAARQRQWDPANAAAAYESHQAV